jgi:hypothetical protein
LLIVAIEVISSVMLLDLAEKRLGWPGRRSIFAPSGSGARVQARLAAGKIGQTLARLPDGAGVKVGILAVNPASAETEAPLAVVCEFPRSVSESTARIVQKLSWNFSRTPLLVTVEPNLLRIWTCCKPPKAPQLNDYLLATVKPDDLSATAQTPEAEAALHALHWINFMSGRFFHEHPQAFRRQERADESLLSNLRVVRQKLLDQELDEDVCHSLLARVIFIQFLFDRKDSAGNAALDTKELQRLHKARVLHRRYKNLGEILRCHADIYRFFRWLNDKFNGDLFPGKEDTADAREAEWQTEMTDVTQVHLNLLEEFVGGRMDMGKGQRCLWPEYSFDAIPLEFISSIYETFVGRGAGVHYTPLHLVDFMLDRVLPWEGEEWNLQILDPACGSGVFLVKAYQRLIHRWKMANPEKESIRVATLRSLLENNLLGVDIDPHAVRVASFSLYLAMCDEIDPRHLWTQVRFPRLRERRIVCTDFFDETCTGIRTTEDARRFDLVIGNAPWGLKSLTREARAWAKNHSWPVAGDDIAPLFLPKAAALAKESGHVTMLQPAGLLLFDRRAPARSFRQQLFAKCEIEEVVNLAALRFGLFAHAVDPTCAITLRPIPPTGERLVYICPKPTHTAEDEYRFVIEPWDLQFIHPCEAVQDDWIWFALMWGGRRDLALARRLSERPTLLKLEAEGMVKRRRGIVIGDQKKRQPEIIGRRIFIDDDFPNDSLLWLDAKKLPINQNPYTHSRDSTEWAAFELPQLIIKHSWLKERFRFRAMMVDSDERTGGIVCKRSYSSVHVPEANRAILEAACLGLNSKIAVYHLLLTSPRFATYRPEPALEDLLSVPLPEPKSDLLKGIENLEQLDERTWEAYALKPSERAIVEDLYSFTLADFKEGPSSTGRQPTRRFNHGENLRENDPDLYGFCEMFLRVLCAGFGPEKPVSATVFQEPACDRLPLRLVGIHLNCRSSRAIVAESLSSKKLITELEKLNRVWLRRSDRTSSVFYQRVARVYVAGQHGPTVFLIKPDRRRYWTRSVALRDADEVSLDLMQWGMHSKRSP